MSLDPKPEADGLRRYGGHWGKRREDTTRCITAIWNSRWRHNEQCKRPRGHGPDGLHCKQHDPAAQKASAEARTRRWAEKSASINRPRRQNEAAREALQQIANGHDDPAVLASDLLKRWDEL